MLLIPATVQVAHAFEHHDHDMAYSIDVDDQLLSNAEDCTLCDFILDSTGLLPSFSSHSSDEFDIHETFYSYEGLEDNQVTAPTLRGPPSL